jgi:hypothetical protein
MNDKNLEASSSKSSPPIFILCDTCHWAAIYFDKNKLPDENTCPQCNSNNNELSSFPIMSNESFIFDYNDKRGVFKPRRSKGSWYAVTIYSHLSIRVFSLYTLSSLLYKH